MNRRIGVLAIVLVLALVGTAGAATLTANATYDSSLNRISANSTFFQIRWNGTSVGASATTGYNGDTRTATTSDTDKYNSHYKTGMTWNTSEIGADSVINSAYVIIYGSAKSSTLGSRNASILDFWPANKSSYAAGDYDNTTFTRMAEDVLYADFNTTGGNGTITYTLNAAGLANISKTGLTSFLFDDSQMTDNITPTWSSNKISSMTFRGATFDSGAWCPQLVIDYTPATEPVSNFTYTVTNRAAPLIFVFNDTSTPAATSWIWSYRNVTPGNNTWVEWTGTKNSTLTLNAGRWDIRLRATNSGGYNLSTQQINVSYDSEFRRDLSSFPQPYYPGDHIFNVPIDTMPVHTNSSEYVANNYGTAGKLFASVGPSNTTGLAYDVVDSSMTTTPFLYTHPEISNRFHANYTTIPIPLPYPDITGADAGAPTSCDPAGDCSAYIYEKDSQTIYELYGLRYAPYDNGTWHAGSQAILTRTNYTLNYYNGQGTTSASGLPTMPMSLMYEEVAAGKINHSIQMSIPFAHSYKYGSEWYRWPASSGGSPYVNNTSAYPPMGTRWRLNASLDTSGFSPQSKVILECLKTYGAIQIDTGGTNPAHAWQLNGLSDYRWNGTDLAELATVNTSLYWEAVDESSLMLSSSSLQANVSTWTPTAHFYMNVSGSAPAGDAPVADFTASDTTVEVGDTVTFTDTSTNSPTGWIWEVQRDNHGYINYYTQNPTTMEYPEAGNFTVILHAINGYGSDIETKTGYIQVSEPTGDDEFGAMAANVTGSLIGGGTGYSYAITSGDYTVTSKAELLTALSTATAGDVIYVTEGTTIDMTGTLPIGIPAGVTLASNRGTDGSSGALIKKTEHTSGFAGNSSTTRYSSGTWEEPMFYVMGNSVRVTGLQLEGEMLDQDEGYEEEYPPVEEEEGDYLVGIFARNVEDLIVDNNEIRGWSWSGVQTAWCTDTYVHHNYIHSNQARGEGYGSSQYGGTVVYEANLYDYNRHAITGSGLEGEQYIARYNIIKGNGAAVGAVHFDVHEDEDVGGRAGDYYYVHHNTFQNGSGYSREEYWAKIASVHIREEPDTGLYISNNDFLAVSTETTGGLPIYQTYDGGSTLTRVYATNNKWMGVLYADNTGIARFGV